MWTTFTTSFFVARGTFECNPTFEASFCQCQKQTFDTSKFIHLVSLTTSSVTASTWLQQVDFFVSKSLTEVLKSYNEHPLVMSNIFCIFLLVVSGPSVVWL